MGFTVSSKKLYTDQTDNHLSFNSIVWGVRLHWVNVLKPHGFPCSFVILHLKEVWLMVRANLETFL